MSSDYAHRVERAMLFVLDNLEEPLPLVRVAQAAGLSKYYFHRIFAASAGETVGHFITRKRLQTAALRLAYELDRDVTEIALASGYSSPSNFSKAFSGFYGLSPSELRVPRGGRRRHGEALPLSALRGAQARSPTLHALHERVRYVDSQALSLCCLPHPRGVGSDGTMALAVRRLAAHVRALGLEPGEHEHFGIRFDHALLTAPSLQHYHVCARCWKGFVPHPPLLPARIPQARYAVFQVAGTWEQVTEQYFAIFAHWPSGARFVPDAPPIERYTMPQASDRYAYEVWIKVRPRRGAT